MKYTAELEKFDHFLMIMDDQLESLERLANGFGINISRDADSFEKLELLFDMVTEGIDSDAKSEFLVTFGRYLGEIVCETYGGHWTLPLDDPKNVNFNTPVIKGHSPVETVEFPPISVMHAYSLRKRAGLLRIAVTSQAAPKPLDIDDMEEK
jgi:hypothetical protein